MSQPRCSATAARARATAMMLGLASATACAQTLSINTPNRTAGGYFGAAVAGLGDVNGDGNADVAVGAPGEGSGGDPAARGRVYVYSGLNGAQIRMLWSPNQRPDGRFGAAVASVPDTDGDGVNDILVGAPGEGASAQVGRAYLYSGDTGALLHVLFSPAQQAGGLFGRSVAGVSDMDGDGRGDLAVGAPEERNGGGPAGMGRVHVYSGGTGALLYTLLPAQPAAGGHFGESVSGVSDTDGDGRGDVVVGAPGESPAWVEGCGQAYLFSGAGGSLIRRFYSPGREPRGSFGECVAGVPDLDGDGRGDLAIGAPAEDPGTTPEDCGRVYVYSGASGVLIWRYLAPTPEANANFGNRIAGLPDVTGDGKGDILIGAWHENPAGGDEDCGRVHIYSGGTGARFRTFLPSGQAGDGLFGFAVAGVPRSGGGADVVVGAIGESTNAVTAAYAGRVYLIRD
ncbi:MAG: FG-GAP repeat protein [Phycisphaerales bacterium]|nr:FG-GAP repeat protein [Phycisphaerales bacterium]